MIKIRSTTTLMAAVALLAASVSPALATSLTLPPSNAMTTGSFGDFLVYSLELNALCGAAVPIDPRCLPAGFTQAQNVAQYPIQSSPGQIDSQVVIYMGSQGNDNKDGNPFPAGASSDDPFRSPTGSATVFAMDSGNEPGGGAEFTGDISGRWDINIGLLRQYLTDPLSGKVHDLVFLFDNNQTGTGTGQALNVWGQVRIIDPSTIDPQNGVPFGVPSNCFELNSSASTGCTDTTGDPLIAAALFAPAIGDFCVDHVTGAAYLVGTAKASDCAPGDYFITNNLGQNTAEFAVFNSLLNDLVKNPANDGLILSVNMKLSNLDDGSEQLWICSTCSVSPVPEPGTILLFGVALVLISVLVARRRHQHE